MTWKDRFHAALLRFVQAKFDSSAREVTGFEQVNVPGFQWSEVTFEPGYTIIEITYNRGMVAEWKGDFAELLDELTWMEGT